MPYKRRMYKRKYRKPVSSRFGRYAGYAKTGLSLASRAFTLAKYVKGLVNVEFKHHTQQHTGVKTTTPTITHISGISQGDQPFNRGGNKIRVKSVRVYGRAFINASATVDTIYRWILVMDRFNTGTVPSVTADLGIDDVDDLPFEGVANSALQNAQKRFVILRDQRLVLSINGQTSKLFDKYFACSIPITYTGGVGTDEGSNTLYLVQISNEPTNGPSVDIRTRLRFIDN